MSNPTLSRAQAFAESPADRPANLIEWQSGNSGTRWEKFRDSRSLDSAFIVAESPFHAWRLQIAVAMGVLMIAVAWVLLGPWREPAHVVTAVGEQRALTLADGSILNLDADSDARIGFTARERRVILARGGARFTVARDSERPFLVSSPHVTVRAVGTILELHVDGKETTVTVVEGRATLLPPVIDESPGAVTVSPRPLSAGQRATVTRDGEVMTLPDAA